jgi:hypothetical protein
MASKPSNNGTGKKELPPLLPVRRKFTSPRRATAYDSGMSAGSRPGSRKVSKQAKKLW